MHFRIDPLISVGPVRLGMSRAELHRVLGKPEASFRKLPSSEHETDSFDSHGLHIYYVGEQPTVEFIEIFAATDGQFDLLGVDPFSTSLQHLVSLLSKRSGVTQDDGSWEFPDISVSLWCEDATSHLITTVGVGVAGYFEPVG